MGQAPLQATEQQQRCCGPVAAPELWEADEDREYCKCCDRKFCFAWRRKHHCRRCGGVVCAKCAPQRQCCKTRVCKGCGMTMKLNKCKFKAPAVP
eukprot:gene15062-22995_t